MRPIPHASLQMQLSLDNFNLAATYDPALCTISPQKLSGCYSCLAGARFKMRCDTNSGSALAHIECFDDIKQAENPILQFAIFCAGDETETSIILSRANVNLHCQTTCPAGKTEFRLIGNLNYLSQKSWIQMKDTIGNLNDNSIDWLSVFGFFANFPHFLWIILAAIFALLIIITIIRINPIFLFYRAIARRLFAIILVFLFLPGIFTCEMDSEKPEYGPKTPPKFTWETLNEFAKDMTKEQLIAYWAKKSGLKTPVALEQSDPRKYESSTRNFDNKAEQTRTVKAQLAENAKRTAINLQKSAKLSQQENPPPAGYQKEYLDPPPTAPDLQKANANPQQPVQHRDPHSDHQQQQVPRQAGSPVPPFVWNYSDLTKEQEAEVEKMRDLGERTILHAQQLLNFFKLENKSGGLAKEMIASAQKLMGMSAPPYQPPHYEPRYHPGNRNDRYSPYHGPAPYRERTGPPSDGPSSSSYKGQGGYRGGSRR